MVCEVVLVATIAAYSTDIHTQITNDPSAFYNDYSVQYIPATEDNTTKPTVFKYYDALAVNRKVSRSIDFLQLKVSYYIFCDRCLFVSKS